MERRSPARLHEGLVYSAHWWWLQLRFEEKCAKEVAFKVALMARVDATSSNGQHQSAAQGEKFLAAIKSKYNKWEEPDKARTEKALPVPDAGEKKSRHGGRRRRAWKKKYGLTDVHKDANRVAFGSQADEYSDSAMGSIWHAWAGGSGRVRQAPKSSKGHADEGRQAELERANAKIKARRYGLASSRCDLQRIEFVDQTAATGRGSERRATDFLGPRVASDPLCRDSSRR